MTDSIKPREKSLKRIAKEATAKHGDRPSPKQWAEAEAIWTSGMMTVESIAKKMGISERAVKMHMAKHKVVRASKAPEHRERVEEAIKQSQIDDATITAARIRETKESHYKLADNFAKLTWEEILKAKRDNLPVSTAMNNLKALDIAFSTIKKVREEKWAVLGLDKDTFVDDDTLPDLVVSELTAEQIAVLRSRDHTEFEDLPEDNNAESDDQGDEVAEE